MNHGGKQASPSSEPQHEVNHYLLQLEYTLRLPAPTRAPFRTLPIAFGVEQRPSKPAAASNLELLGDARKTSSLHTVIITITSSQHGGDRPMMTLPSAARSASFQQQAMQLIVGESHHQSLSPKINEPALSTWSSIFFQAKQSLYPSLHEFVKISLLSQGAANSRKGKA